MKAKELFKKVFSPYLVGNLAAMVVVVVLLFLGVKYGLAWYTHHGEGIRVPKVEGMIYSNARSLLMQNELNIVVSDSGFNKKLAADCILAQNPGEGMMVKAGHTVYVTVNSPASPSFQIPDVVDNSSFREAEAKLMAMGFKLLPPKYVEGEKDWVYGIISRGRRVSTGDRISIDAPLTLIVGNGRYDMESEDIDYVEAEPPVGGDLTGGMEQDDFEEVVE